MDVLAIVILLANLCCVGCEQQSHSTLHESHWKLSTIAKTTIFVQKFAAFLLAFTSACASNQHVGARVDLGSRTSCSKTCNRFCNLIALVQDDPTVSENARGEPWQERRRRSGKPSQQKRLMSEENPVGLPFRVQRALFPSLEVSQLASELTLTRDTIAVWDNPSGRTIQVPEPRLTAWYSDVGATYEYCGKVMHPPPGGLTPTLSAVRDALEGNVGVRYDSVVVNYYEHGKIHFNWHHDPFGVWNETTTVVSIGSPRTFALRRVEDKLQRWDYRMHSGDAVTMFEGCQRTMQHRVKPEKTADAAGPRISLVFKRLTS